MQEMKRLKGQLGPFEQLQKHCAELIELLEITEESDAASLKHLEEESAGLEKKVGELEFQKFLSASEDPSSAILSINAGPGGTESCDWASMLLRMYNRWSDQKGYKAQMIDLLPG